METNPSEFLPPTDDLQQGKFQDTRWPPPGEVHGDWAIVEVDAVKLSRLMARFRRRQSLIGAILAGLAVGVVGGFLWGALVGITGLQYELEWVPMIGLGFLIGSAVRYGGRGIDPVFAWTGAVLALGSGLAGSVWTTANAVAWQMQDVGNFYLFQYADLATWLRLYAANTGWIDVLCLAFTAWEGYALGRYRLTPSQLATLAPRGSLP